VPGGGFVADRCREWCNLHGMRHHVVEHDPTLKGFAVLPRRWVVDRSFGWPAHWGGLFRDRAGFLDASATSLALVAILFRYRSPPQLHPNPCHGTLRSLK
jgi:transposase